MGLGHRLRPPGEPRTPRRCHPITASSAISYACSPVTVVPATIAASDILALNPDGIFLSNGPGDPAATGTYAVPLIRDLIEHGIPTSGICLGHRMLGIAVAGAARGRCTRATMVPITRSKDLKTRKVEIASMNHGFAVDRASLLPDPTCGCSTAPTAASHSGTGRCSRCRPFETSLGPRDSHYLFERFAQLMRTNRHDARDELLLR